MKKFYLIGLIVFCLFMSLGLKIYIRNNVTVAWDPIIYNGEGVVTYEVYLQDTETGLFTLLGETADVEFNLDVPLGVEQLVGVRTKVVDGEGEHFSLMSMSDVEGVPPFGLQQAVPAPLNIRLK